MESVLPVPNYGAEIRTTTKTASEKLRETQRRMERVTDLKGSDKK